MTKELIENIRAIIVPYMAHDLRRINYEKMGEIDAEQFSEDMNEILDLAAKTLEQQPCEDAISRQAAIDALDKRFDEIPMEQTTEILLLRKDLRTLSPVQPKYNTSEWCKTCKEYNHDKHCCPRYNNVIRETVEEIKQSKTGHWIPVSERLPELDDDGYSTYVLVSFSNFTLPFIGQLRKTDGENHWYEGDDEKTLDSFGLHVNAWMPLPKAYEPQESEDKE
jgi:hypothetical protein